MRISPVGAQSSVGGVLFTPPSPILAQLQWAKHHIAKAKHAGAKEISFAIQDDALVSRLRNLYGKDSVSVESSDTKRVTVKL